MQRVAELVQDPRSVEEKQQVVLQVGETHCRALYVVGSRHTADRVPLDSCCPPQEVEDTLVSFLERGATVESDTLSVIKALLPPDVTKQLDELIPPPPNAQQQAWDAAMAENNEPPVIYTADSVLENQIGVS